MKPQSSAGADGTLPPEYFDAVYDRDPDPWGFASSDYERAKYDATMAALPAHPVAAGFEVGCSIGVLTRRLADTCGSLLAVDVASAPVAQARRRCADLQHVEIRRMAVPAEWPSGVFDLIVFSEVLYYFSRDDIRLAAALTRSCLAPGGMALLVHYTLSTDYPCHGDEATQDFIAAAGLLPILQRREAMYRLDLLRG